MTSKENPVITVDRRENTPQVGRKVRFVEASWHGYRLAVVTTPIGNDEAKSSLGGDTVVSVLSPERSAYVLSYGANLSPDYVADKFGRTGMPFDEARALAFVVSHALDGRLVGA